MRIPRDTVLVDVGERLRPSLAAVRREERPPADPAKNHDVTAERRYGDTVSVLPLAPRISGCSHCPPRRAAGGRGEDGENCPIRTGGNRVHDRTVSITGRDRSPQHFGRVDAGHVALSDS